MRTKKIIAFVLLIGILMITLSVSVLFLVNKFRYENEIPDVDEMSPSYFLTPTSFFEDIFNEVDPSVGEYINSKYEDFPLSGNTTNLQSHGTAIYENINGGTVMADAYYRVRGEALNDPNAGLGLLLYQAIQYKIAHPEEEMEICFTSYRVSPTAAVCVLPESRYYGYMRSLYGNGNDYDQNGFVRIAFMLVEAAKMGINVTIVGQWNSYGVYQYNANGELVMKGEASYITYFNNGLKQECYEKYAQGKRVSDFMIFCPVEWTIAEKGGTDMMHLKSLTASHYLSTEGKEYENAVFFSSSNLDAIDYNGCNGNGGAQSGVIVTGHEKIYSATVNYIHLMAQYPGQEELYEFRNVMSERNSEQMDLILAGRDDEISNDERVLYFGSETDSVFKCYFTPLPAEYDAWDSVRNPVCEHVDNLYRSSIEYPEEPITFAYHCASFVPTSNIANTMMDMVDSAFLNSKNPDNRVSINALNYHVSNLSILKIGETVGYKYLNSSNWSIHSKDMHFSYILNGKRQYVSLLTSCNFHTGALYYQTNSFLTITETEETGNMFYKIFGDAATGGCIVNDNT